MNPAAEKICATLASAGATEGDIKREMRDSRLAHLTDLPPDDLAAELVALERDGLVTHFSEYGSAPGSTVDWFTLTPKGEEALPKQPPKRAPNRVFVLPFCILAGLASFLTLQGHIAWTIACFAAIAALAIIATQRNPGVRQSLKQEVTPDPPFKGSRLLPLVLIYPALPFLPTHNVAVSAGAGIAFAIVLALFLHRELR